MTEVKESELELISNSIFTNIFTNKYPEERRIYCAKSGQVREVIVAYASALFGYYPELFSIQANGIDIILRDISGKIIMLIEVTNDRLTSNIGLKKIKSIIKNADSSLPNLLIVSFIDNLNKNDVDVLRALKIHILEIGFQTQPYYGIHPNTTLDCMKPYNKRTINKEVEIYRYYLEFIGLLNKGDYIMTQGKVIYKDKEYSPEEFLKYSAGLFKIPKIK